MASPSHEDLDKAAEAAEERLSEEPEIETEVETEVETELEPEEPEEPIDNKERTKMGRKLAAANQEILTMRQQLTDITSLLDKIVTKEEPEEDEDEYISVKSLPTYLEKINKKKSESDNKYQSEYVQTITRLGVENEDHDAIFAEMMEKHNVRHSDNATMDAMLNYERAKNSLNNG